MLHQPDPYQNLGEELHHKLWTTKGVRFNAHKRMLRKSRLSNQAIGYLTAYVIIINLLGLFNFSDHFVLSSQLIGFATTALSILILVFSQIEASFEYNLKADKYHNCAKAIGKLYLELRDIMLSRQYTDDDKEDNYKIIAGKYAAIIEAYDNHNSIDYQNFKAEFYKEFSVTKTQRNEIYLTHYFTSLFLYHFLIGGPLIGGFLYFLLK